MPVDVLERELVLDALFVHAPPTFSQTHRKECFSSDCSILMLLAFAVSEYALVQIALLAEILKLTLFRASDRSQTAISEADTDVMQDKTAIIAAISTDIIFFDIVSPPSVNKNNMNYDFYDEIFIFFYFYLNFVAFTIFSSSALSIFAI